MSVRNRAVLMPHDDAIEEEMAAERCDPCGACEGLKERVSR